MSLDLYFNKRITVENINSIGNSIIKKENNFWIKNDNYHFLIVDGNENYFTHICSYGGNTDYMDEFLKKIKEKITDLIYYTDEELFYETKK